MNNSLTVSELLSKSRQSQRMALREFGSTLGVSHTSVKQWEDGVASPSEDLLKSMLMDKRDWVSQLAEDIYVARYRSTLAALREAAANQSVTA